MYNDTIQAIDFTTYESQESAQNTIKPQSSQKKQKLSSRTSRRQSRKSSCFRRFESPVEDSSETSVDPALQEHNKAFIKKALTFMAVDKTELKGIKLSEFQKKLGVTQEQIDYQQKINNIMKILVAQEEQHLNNEIKNELQKHDVLKQIMAFTQVQTKESRVRHQDGTLVVNESIFKAGKPQFKYAAIKDRYDAIAAKKQAKIAAKLERQKELDFINEQAKLAKEQEMKMLMKQQAEKNKLEMMMQK